MLTLDERMFNHWERVLVWEYWTQQKLIIHVIWEKELKIQQMISFWHSHFSFMDGHQGTIIPFVKRYPIQFVTI